MNASKTTGLAYDATAILGFGPLRNALLPDAAAGEIVIRYAGWSLRELSDSSVVRERKLLCEQDWYDKYRWANEKLPPGIYRLGIPVPNSSRKTFAEQVRSLPASDQPAPVVLVATALLAHRLQTGEDLLNNDFTRCNEQTADDTRVVLDWLGGRLYVDYEFGDFRNDRVWLSSVRTS